MTSRASCSACTFIYILRRLFPIVSLLLRLLKYDAFLASSENALALARNNIVRHSFEGALSRLRA